MPNEDRNPLLDIDEDRLDQEWVGHMRLAFNMIVDQATAKRNLAEAKAEAELAKDQLKARKAGLWLEIKMAPSEFGLADKPSETTVESAVLIHDRYKDAQLTCYEANAKVIQLEEVYDLCQGRVYVCRDKKEALQDLVKLHLTGFHSEPRADTKTAREYAEHAERVATRKPLPDKKAKRK